SGDPAANVGGAVGPIGNSAVRPAEAVMAILRNAARGYSEDVACTVGSRAGQRHRRRGGTSSSRFLRLSKSAGGDADREASKEAVKRAGRTGGRRRTRRLAGPSGPDRGRPAPADLVERPGRGRRDAAAHGAAARDCPSWCTESNGPRRPGPGPRGLGRTRSPPGPRCRPAWPRAPKTTPRGP